ncbi:MAG: class I SAM-dependent methyltransferase [Patescibacteria group bacterium]
MEDNCYHKMYTNEERHWWFRSKIDITRSLIEKFIGDIGGKKVLDAGCGTGFLSKSVVPEMGDIWAVDNCGLSLSYAEKRGHKNIFSADLGKDLPFESSSFDLCLCMDVIEHNEDDAAITRELARVLKSGATLIATVPAMRSLWGPQDEKLGHYRRYGTGDFKKLFEENFEIKKISYFNFFLFPVIYLIRKIFNLAPGLLRQRDELDINSKFFNNLLYNIFHLESHLLKYADLPFGVSVVIVAQKK